MPLDPEGQPDTSSAPDPATAADDASAEREVDAIPSDAGPAPSAEDRLATIYRQWATPGRPSGEFRALVRTTPEDPAGLPFLDLLGVKPAAVEDAWSVWGTAQLASDATPLGRALRPLVALVPAGGRWIAGRSMGRTCLLEPIDHPTPAAALHAAEARFGLIAARRVGEVLDEFAVTLLDHDADDGDAEDDIDAVDLPTDEDVPADGTRAGNTEETR